MTKTPNYVFDTDDELYHWGILGQKWGRRRFQNEDGSLTAEGRERYGVSEARSKSGAQKAKARISYNTQKYKADLKSKAQRDKDRRAAKEERNRIREAEKTARIQKKEQAKTDTKGQAKFKLGKTKNMSDEDLQKAVDRLKLQAEYNKSYVLATQPNSALAKADRFFEGPTGKAALEISKAVLPAIATSATNKILESSLKYHNKLDREKAEAEIEKNKASAERERALARSNDATAESTKSKTEQDRLDAIQNRKIAATNAKNEVEKLRFEELRTQDKHEREQRRLDAESSAKIKLDRSKQAVDSHAKYNETKAKTKLAELDRKIKEAENFGYDWKPDAWSSHVNGKLQNAQNNQAIAMNSIRNMVATGEITTSEGLDLMKKFGLLVK